MMKRVLPPFAMHPIPQRSTLVHQLIEILRNGILDGVWEDYLPGELELSQKFQVSRMTLRAALEKLTREGMLMSSQGCRRRVLKAKLGKVPKRFNRRIVLLTAVPIEGMRSLHMFQVDVLREQLATAGFELEVQVSATCFSPKPEATLERLRREKPAATWVVINSSPPLQRWFMEQRMPCVVIGARHPGIKLPSVGTDYYALGQHAAGQFLRRHHRQLAILIPTEDVAGHANTVSGFRAACDQVVGAEMRVIRHDGTPAGIQNCLAKMLKTSPPTGLLVAIPQFVLTTVTFLTNAGVRVPHDTSVISRDSDPLLDFMVPPLARYMIDTSLFVQKVCRTVLITARGGSASMAEKLLLPDFVPGATLDFLSEKNTSRG